jgi:transcriptional regulator with XRE-family HTH domain
MKNRPKVRLIDDTITQSIAASRPSRLLSELKKLQKTEEKLNRQRMADDIGVSESAIRKWEAGSGIDNAALAKLDELGADVRFILTGKRMPTGDCPHGKLCERLPKSMHLAAAMIECACGMDKAEREAADETIRQVIALLEARQQESRRTGHAS